MEDNYPHPGNPRALPNTEVVFPEHWDQVICLGAPLGLRKLCMFLLDLEHY